jgi:hypothetical protein
MASRGAETVGQHHAGRSEEGREDDRAPSSAALAHGELERETRVRQFILMLLTNHAHQK